MASGPEILVRYVAETAALSKATGEIETAGGKVKQSMGGVAKAVGTGLAVGAVVAFGKASIGAAEESEVATNRLDAVFKSMGDSTGTASKAAQDYASTLSKQIGVEDEVIMSGQAMLATFGAVSNQTARSAGIFDRATSAAADLAAAGFGSIESNSVQLGKALQDPIKGLAALGKSGVTFTDAQKEMIAQMVKSGDLLGAQKIVLGAIEGQVKGTAAATVTESAKMSVAFGEISEAVGMALLPVLTKLAPIMTTVAGAIAANAGWIAPLVGGLIALAAVVKVVTFAQIAWNLAMSLNPIGLLVIGIAALIAAIVLLWKNWDTVSAALADGWDRIKDAASGVIAWLKSNWPLIVGIIAGPLGLIVALAITKWDAIKGAITTALNAIRSTMTTVWNAIRTLVATVMGAVEAAVRTGWNAIQSAVSTAAGTVRTVVTAVTTAFNVAKAAATALAGYVSAGFVAALGIARGALSSLDGVIDGVKAGLSAVKSAATTVANYLEGGFKSAVNAGKRALDGLSGLANGIAGAFNSAASAVRGLVDAIKSIPSRIHLPDIPSLPFGLGRGVPMPSVGPVPMLAGGGVITRPTLAVVGEGGREIVTPERLLRSIVGESRAPNVRVFIGDQELRGLVRVEVDGATSGLARTLLAGARA